LKVTEKLHISIKKVLYDADILDDVHEIELLSGIYSDDSGQGYNKESEAIKELADLSMFFTINKWNCCNRIWNDYPVDL
jgi:hypothetical protein